MMQKLHVLLWNKFFHIRNEGMQGTVLEILHNALSATQKHKYRNTKKDTIFKFLCVLVNNALRTHSWEELYGLPNGIRFCWVKHACAKKTTNTHTPTCTQISAYACTYMQRDTSYTF